MTTGRGSPLPAEATEVAKPIPKEAAPFNKVDKGGHFAAWELPQLLTAEVRAAFGSLRQ